MKTEFTIRHISKSECTTILEPHHYLSSISKGFKSGINYGLFHNDQLCGVCIYTGFPVPELVVGMYGLDRADQDGFFELSRLCLTPAVQATEHNIASWFVSRTIKLLRREQAVRAILSYADDDHHQGTVYRACNFKHYGLSDPKKDFWLLQEDGSYRKHSRGKMKGLAGEWRSRSRKRRFVLTFDKKLTMRWGQVAIQV